MTEIPEHLLKRSRDRRSALGLGGDDAASSAPASTAPATTAAASTPAAPAAASGPPARGALPQPAAAAPSKPDSAVVAAHKHRKRVPAWAMMMLGLLPVWGVLYGLALTSQPVEASGPLSTGAATYGNCASCHGATGEGGAGYSFNNGEVFLTFPHIEDQIRWVMYGTQGYNQAGIEIYGDPTRAGGAHVTGALGIMPAQAGNITDAEILAVVCHERYDLSGVETAVHAEEFALWCADDSVVWADIEAGGALATLSERVPGTLPIGDAPKAGSPA